MINRVSEFIEKNGLADKTIVVGFSGGYDSMCLLDILSEIKKEPEFEKMRVIAAHYNHNWRGEESKREKEICRLFASAKGFEFYTKDAPATLKKTENDARIARYEFFADAYDFYDADAVFTAHNRDDNAETVLYRIIKGTGVVGLKGISEKREFFYRPLLKSSRAEILEYCKLKKLTPNNDSSNSNTNYKRNYIRLNIIPALEKVNPMVKDALNTLASNAICDNEIIEEYLNTIRPNLYMNDGILTEEYKKLSTPVKLRILYEFIQKLNLDYDSKKIHELYDFIEQNSNQKNGTTMSLASALWLYADNKIIETIPKKSAGLLAGDSEILVEPEGEYEIGKYIFTISKCSDKDLFVFPQSTAKFAYVDLSQEEFPLILRTRRDGDIITPFGMSGSMKLKKYLNSKGVSRHIRDQIILLCNKEEVLWAAGIGLNNKVGVTTKPTHVIQIRLESEKI